MPTLTPFFLPSPPQESPAARGSGNDGGGEIAETGTMFDGGWGRLAARGEGSRGGDGGVALV